MQINLNLDKPKHKPDFEAKNLSFEVRLEVSPNSKGLTIEKEFTKVFGQAFRKVHKRGMIPCNTKVTLELHSRDTLFDLGSWETHRHMIRSAIEKIGMKRPGLSISHWHDEDCFILVTCTYRAMSPLELFKTEGGYDD